MKIDEARAYVLSKYSKVKGKVTVTESDHNPIICTFNQLWSDKSENEKQRYELFKFKDQEGQLTFNELTSSNTLSKCIQDTNVKQSSKKWLKTFNNVLHRSFKKVRITNRKQKNENVHNLMRAKSQIGNKINEISELLECSNENVENYSLIMVSLYESIDLLDEKIADICAIKNMNLIKEHYENVTDCSGAFNIPKMWGLKKKLNLASRDVPSAKKDKAGNMITTKNGLLALYRNTYIERLSHKKIRPEYEHMKELKKKLFELRFEISSKMPAEDWTVNQIEKICKSLKNSKARDECGLVYELFKAPYAGTDIFSSLTKLFNLIQKELIIPDFFELMSITSLYKNKGVRSDISNERGIFNLPKVRSLLDKLLYSEVYESIDQNMSFSNCGGRKERNIRDHLFVVYACINDVINGCGESFDIQGYDVMNDMWDVKVQNKKFSLI